MMNTKRVTHGCLIATLVLIATSAMASPPSGQAAPSKQAAKPPPRRCIATQAGSVSDDRPAPSDGQRASLRALPAYVHDLLRDPAKANLDGAADPCRLVDNEPDDDVANNDGLDKHKLLDQIDGWMALNRHALDDDGHDLDSLGRQVTFEFEDADHHMHAYVGYSRIDGDHLYHQPQQWQPWLWHDGALGPLHGALGQDGQQSTFANNTQPVPEPGAWAMLLAGLALIGLGVRRRAA